MKKRNPAVSRYVTQIEAAVDRMTPQRRAMLHRHVAAVFPDDVVQLIEELTPIPADASDFVCESIQIMRSSIRLGFVIALARYSRELKSNAEAMQIISTRAAGAHRGRNTQTTRSQDRRSRVRAMLDQGIEVPEIAKALGCSASTVYRLSQPAGSTAAKPAKKLRRR